MAAKEKMSIRELYKIVHRGQDKGISALSTLARYGVSNRAYYTQCKRNGLPNWRSLNEKNVLVRKRAKPQKRELSGGSLEAPKNNAGDIRKRVAFDVQSIELKKRKSRELNI